MSEKNPKVDFYFNKAKAWREEMELLRTIVLGTGLTEELKWGVPCYTLEGSNVVLIHAFKEYCALLFHKGALLTSPDLIQQTENVQGARQLRFEGLAEIQTRRAAIRHTIAEAIDVQRAGLEVEYKPTSEFRVAEEFQSALDGDAGLKTAFEALTPGRQRAYLLHFSAPKLAKTRAARVEAARPLIHEGKGPNERQVGS